MNLVKANNLEIGRIPRVVGTISSRRGLESFPHECKDLCDIAEVRLDEVGIFDGWVNACQSIEATGVPVLLTLRSSNEGGKCTRSDVDRLEILRQGLPFVSIIDVEFNSGLAAKIKSDVEEAGKTLLVSYHDFSGTPTRDFLEDVIQRASQHASIVKISVMVKSDDDLIILNSLLGEERKVPLSLIGMGAKGTRTRTSYPCMGSALTYGYLDFVSAPGQLSARHLVDHLRAVHPVYNEEFIIRHEIFECV